MVALKVLEMTRLLLFPGLESTIYPLCTLNFFLAGTLFPYMTSNVGPQVRAPHLTSLRSMDQEQMHLIDCLFRIKGTAPIFTDTFLQYQILQSMSLLREDFRRIEDSQAMQVYRRRPNILLIQIKLVGIVYR